MNINPEYNESEFQLDAETAMASCMEGILTTLIEPAMEKGELSETDELLLGVIGSTLKVIAEKAKAYEELQGIASQGDHFRN
tara:strand:+ start:101 stop:346 length:246 start_codon:yes stop_codon:yes gene_type:complete